MCHFTTGNALWDCCQMLVCYCSDDAEAVVCIVATDAACMSWQHINAVQLVPKFKLCLCEMKSIC